MTVAELIVMLTPHAGRNVSVEMDGYSHGVDGIDLVRFEGDENYTLVVFGGRPRWKVREREAELSL